MRFNIIKSKISEICVSQAPAKWVGVWGRKKDSRLWWGGYLCVMGDV